MLKYFKSLIPFKWKRHLKDHLGVPSLHWSLQNLKSKGFNPMSVLDIGAYEGLWTIDFLEVFPNARLLMLEAQAKKTNALLKIVEENKNVRFQVSLLSSIDGEEVLFYENETASHIINRTSNIELQATSMKTKTVDSILKEINFPLPEFLKLDVQGYELEVLKGAQNTLTNAEVCLLEVSLLDLGDGMPLASTVINFMAEFNYQMYDITQFMRRPYDKALFQIDLMFIKKDSSLIKEKRWN